MQWGELVSCMRSVGGVEFLPHELSESLVCGDEVS